MSLFTFFWSVENMTLILQTLVRFGLLESVRSVLMAPPPPSANLATTVT